MKGGARLRLDLDEGWCETLHDITIHHKGIDLDEGWCETLHDSGDEGRWGRWEVITKEVVTKGSGYDGKWRGREVLRKGSGHEGKWLRWEVARKGSDHEGKW